MNVVTLTADGRIMDRGKIVERSPLAFLGYKVEPEAGFSLRSWFMMFTRYPRLARLNRFFDAFLERYRAAPGADCVYQGFDCLELSKTVEMIGFPGKPRLEIYMSFNGVSGDQTCEIKSIQWEQLLDMPVRFGRLKHVVFGDKVDVFEFETVYTLFEVIDAIGWELSFHGTPAQCNLERAGVTKGGDTDV